MTTEYAETSAVLLVRDRGRWRVTVGQEERDPVGGLTHQEAKTEVEKRLGRHFDWKRVQGIGPESWSGTPPQFDGTTA